MLVPTTQKGVSKARGCARKAAERVNESVKSLDTSLMALSTLRSEGGHPGRACPWDNLCRAHRLLPSTPRRLWHLQGGQEGVWSSHGEGRGCLGSVEMLRPLLCIS